MSWIESHIEIESHPKTLKLQRCLGCSLEHTIGVLHRFWWWTMKYCEDGQIEKYGLETIGQSLGIDANKLVECGWIDITPRLQLHDWWDYTKHYMHVKYKHNPDKLFYIKSLYEKTKRQRSKQRSINRKNNTIPFLSFPLQKKDIKLCAFAPPKLEELQTIIQDQATAQDFLDYYSSKGWVVGGRAPMRNWQAAARRWLRNKSQYQKPEVLNDKIRKLMQ